MSGAFGPPLSPSLGPQGAGATGLSVLSGIAKTRGLWGKRKGVSSTNERGSLPKKSRREKRGFMHRWFRICAMIALMASFQTGFAEEAPTVEETAVPTGSPLTLKHKLRPTVQQLVEQQNKQLEF